MLIEFTVGNYLSFKDKKTFSMEATGISEHKENVITLPRHKLLKGAAVYGANASGKSNLVKAIGLMKEIIKNSSKLNSQDTIEVTPFLLNNRTKDEPSFFEILFLHKEMEYRYGFEVSRSKIHGEWLFTTSKNKERMLFLRENEFIEIEDSLKAKQDLIEVTKANTLFLSVLDSFKNEIATSIFEWLTQFHVSLSTDRALRLATLWALNPPFGYDDDETKIVRQFMHGLNLGIKKYRVQQEENDQPESKNLGGLITQLLDFFDVETKPILTSHDVYSDDGNVVSEVEFKLDEDESTGTKKIFDLLGPIAWLLPQGGCLVLDEMDANLHPIITREIIRLFNNPETNPKNSQLIITTHDTNLLSYGDYRRDQIWFTEKDKYGATDLYSLAEFKLPDGKKVRSDASMEEHYLEGRYGAIPYVGDISKILKDE